MTVTRDDAPEHAVPAGREWRQADFEQGRVLWADPRVALVDTLPVGVLDADRAEDWLDLSVEPDPDGWRRGLERMPDPRVGAIEEGVSRRQPRRQQEGCHRQQSPHYRGCVGPSTP